MDITEQAVVAQIGDNLRAERVRRRLTQDSVAVLCGLATTQVARMERGETDSGISKYVRIAAVIGVPLAALLAGVEWNGNPISG